MNDPSPPPDPANDPLPDRPAGAQPEHHDSSGLSPWRRRLHEIIFESDTPAGRQFDVWLLIAIAASVAVVMLESIEPVRAQHGTLLIAAEWVFTALFTVEYVLRLLTVRRPWRYATSFFGIVDLLAILPTFVGLVVPGAHVLTVVRTLRILRVFRILKLVHYLHELRVLKTALVASRRKIAVFICTVLTITVILGSLMYLVEGGRHGFDNIPRSVYWAIVTLTTVGYGDIAPQTPLGQALAALVMVLGYGTIAVPTGIVSVELARASGGVSGQSCPDCSAEGHALDARHCKFCGARL